MNSPNQSKRSPKILALVISVPLALLAALYFSRGTLLKYLVDHAVQSAAEKEILIRVNSLSVDKLEMDISSKSPIFELKNISCIFNWNFLGNSLKALSTIPFDPYSAQLSIDFGLFRSLKWDLKIETSEKKELPPLVAKGEMTFLPLQFLGGFEGGMYDWDYQGKVELERKKGQWAGSSQPIIKLKNRLEIQPLIKVNLAEISHLDLELRPEHLVSNEIKLNSPLSVSWEDNQEQQEWKIYSPSIGVKLPSTQVPVELQQVVTQMKKETQSKTWEVEGGVEKIRISENDFQLKYRGLIETEEAKNLNISGEMKDVRNEIPVRFGIVRKPGTDTIVGTISSNMDLVPDGIVAKMIKEFKKGIVLSQGKLKIKGEFSQARKSEKSAIVSWELNSLSGLINEIPFKNINSTGSLKVFPELKTKQVITVKADSIGQNLSMDSFLAKASLAPPDTVRVEGAGAKLAGGMISVSPFSSSLSQPSGGVDIKLNHIDLDKLLRTLAGGRLSGTGSIDGAIRVNWKKEGLEIPSFRLYSIGKGKLKYTDPVGSFFGKKVEYLSEFQSLLAEGNQALVMKALENFDYEKIELNATRSINGKLDISLNLKGRNPDLIRGQPFDITLPISGDVESLILKSVLQSSVVDEVNKHRQ